MLSNYKTFVSVANDDDIYSLLDGILCVAKYRPYMEIRWLDENRIHVDCISQLNDKIYIEGEVSGCTIEYTILAPLSQSEEILVSPERDYVACVIYRKWNNGQKAITDLFFRRISDKSRLFVNLKRNPFNPENDKVLVRFDGIQKIEMKWQSRSSLNLVIDHEAPVLYQRKEDVEIELEIQSKGDR